MVSSTYVYLLVFILGYLTYVAYTFKTRIHCTFRRVDRSKIEKWAKMMQGGKWPDIEFEGGWYHVHPGRTVIMWKIIFGFFPMPYREADYREGDANALDPANFNVGFEDKERKLLDTADAVRGWSEGSRKAMETKGKKGFMASLMPLLIIIVVAIFGWMIWTLNQKVDAVGNGLNMLQQMLQQMKK